MHAAATLSEELDENSQYHLDLTAKVTVCKMSVIVKQPVTPTVINIIINRLVFCSTSVGNEYWY